MKVPKKITIVTTLMILSSLLLISNAWFSSVSLNCFQKREVEILKNSYVSLNFKNMVISQFEVYQITGKKWDENFDNLIIKEANKQEEQITQIFKENQCKKYDLFSIFSLLFAFILNATAIPLSISILKNQQN